MRNLIFTVAYDGTNYYGFQYQPKLPTIQGELEGAFEELVDHPATVIGASRTDAGVHARGQIVKVRADTTIPTANFPQALNSELPDDIVVKAAQEVKPTFDPRSAAHKKIYSYQIYSSRQFSPFLRNYAYQIRYSPDLEAMEEAAKHLIGCHDFSSFRASGCIFEDPVREILEIEILKVKKNLTAILVTGTSFLYNMVRIIVGTLLKVGEGELPPKKVKEILKAQDRRRAGPTVLAEGLCLERIKYL